MQSFMLSEVGSYLQREATGDVTFKIVPNLRNNVTEGKAVSLISLSMLKYFDNKPEKVKISEKLPEIMLE